MKLSVFLTEKVIMELNMNSFFFFFLADALVFSIEILKYFLQEKNIVRMLKQRSMIKIKDDRLRMYRYRYNGIS